MTSPKEALELKPCPFCGGEAEIIQRGNNLYSTVYECTDCGCRLSTGETFNYGSQWNTRATPSLEGDAVERVARIIDPTAFTISPSVFGLDTEDEMERETVVGPVRSIARGKARAILATGLVPDEAAIRTDEREKCAKIAESKQKSIREFSVAADIAAAIRSNQAKP